MKLKLQRGQKPGLTDGITFKMLAITRRRSRFSRSPRRRLALTRKIAVQAGPNRGERTSTLIAKGPPLGGPSNCYNKLNLSEFATPQLGPGAILF